MQILTFDLGGTLMEYTGMPDSWTDYYKQGFEAIAHYYHCNISAFHIEKSVEILCSFNQIATLTDLPTAMPDKLFQKDIAQLLPYFDFYVSSLSCGFRKPAIRGLQMISEHFGIPITELIFIGDEEKDRKTADNAGCRFIQISRKQKDRGAIGDLGELVELLGRFS